MIINRAEVIFYILYLHILIAVNLYVMLFSDYEIPLLFMNLVSISGLIFISYLTRYIVIEYNLNPLIKYGHLFSKSTFSLLGRDNLTYAKCKLLFFRFDLINKNHWYEFKSTENFANDIHFAVERKLIDITREFKKLGSYRINDTHNVSETYDELLKNYERYNLQLIISKKELEELLITEDLDNSSDFSIQMLYIDSGIHSRRDVIVGLDDEYHINSYDTQVFSNFTFDYTSFFSVIFLIWVIFIEVIFERAYDPFYGYDLLFLILKTLQYNLFAYLALFLLLKKYLYR